VKPLLIKASTHDASRSVVVAGAYLTALKLKLAKLELDTIPLRDAGLPEFNGDRAMNRADPSDVKEICK